MCVHVFFDGRGISGGTLLKHCWRKALQCCKLVAGGTSGVAAAEGCIARGHFLAPLMHQ